MIYRRSLTTEYSNAHECGACRACSVEKAASVLPSLPEKHAGCGGSPGCVLLLLSNYGNHQFPHPPFFVSKNLQITFITNEKHNKGVPIGYVLPVRHTVR